MIDMVKVHVRVGESSCPDGRDVEWKAEKENDLILSNFGIILAGIIRAPPVGATSKTVSVLDTGNNARTIYVYISGSNIFLCGTGGTRVGVGSSSQAAARGDYNLIAQLGSWADTDAGTWTASTGRVTFSGSVLLSAGGTVREVGFIGVWWDSGSVLRNILLFRDVISDVVIAAGKYAFLQWTIQL